MNKYEMSSKKIIHSKRIYLDELQKIYNIDLKDFTCFSVIYNTAKMAAYNRMYNEKYNQYESNETVYKFIQDNFHLNSYWVTNVLSDADGIFKSQFELFETNKKQIEEQLKNIKEKKTATVRRLTNLKKIKEQLIIRSKKIKNKQSISSLKFKTYKGAHHGLKDTNKNIFFIGENEVSAVEYENFIVNEIKKAKSKIGLLTFTMNRKKDKLTQLSKPKRVCFGSRKLFKSKDTKSFSYNNWKRKLYLNKYGNMTICGRSDLYFGNSVAKYDENHNLTISYYDKNGNVKTVFIPNVTFHYGQKEIDSYIKEQNQSVKNKEKNRPIAYQIKICEDKNYRTYLSISAVLTLPKKEYVNYDTTTGVVSIDMNVDHLAMTELDKNGNLIYQRILSFNVYGKNKGSIRHEVSRVTGEVIHYCKQKKKCLVIEKLDLEKKKQKLKYKNKKYNKLLSGFVYAKIKEYLNSKAYREDIYIYQVNPAYTSQIGKLKYMKKLGISIHIAAAYVIGRRGMGFKEKIPKYLLPLLKEPEEDIAQIEQKIRKKNNKKTEKEILKQIQEETLRVKNKYKHRNWHQWKKYSIIVKKLKQISKHLFYQNYRLNEIEFLFM